ncbi:MAG: hypothetical protein IPJ76_08300 [Flavobacteriales bacterium]|nr:MAG: hypothetical protein IPJ76_08300 [Flavobacteriales bacterium]
MPLFQRSVLDNYLKQLDATRVAAAYRTFTDFFHHPERQANIRDSKDEQFQEGFGCTTGPKDDGCNFRTS